MSKTGKQRKNTVKKYDQYSKEEFLILLQESITQYIILTKSGEKAKEILTKYSILSEFDQTKSYELVVKTYEEITEYAKTKGIYIPKEWYNVEISDRDVIERLNENKMLMLKWIEEHSNLFDSYNEEYSQEVKKQTLPEGYNSYTELEMSRVTEKYKEIIKKEFEVNKKRILKN